MTVPAAEKTKCSRCKRVIFTYGDSFLPDPLAPADAMRNVPLMDSHANGAHLGDCDSSLAAKLDQMMNVMRSNMAYEGMAAKEIDETLARRKKAWLGE